MQLLVIEHQNHCQEQYCITHGHAGVLLMTPALAVCNGKVALLACHMSRHIFATERFAPERPWQFTATTQLAIVEHYCEILLGTACGILGVQLLTL